MDAEIAGLLRREVSTLVFDQYGTIVDMQGGLTTAVIPFLAGKGWTGNPHRFVTWWRRTLFEDSMIDSLCNRGHTSYRQIGHRAVSNVMRRAGIDYTHEEVRWLVARIERLKPFPDVPDALEVLHRRYRLAILSNGDPDMLEAARPHIGFEFDARISVEEAGYFKPHHRDVREGLRTPRRRSVERALRRQPRVRLHRGQGVRHAHRVHRSTKAALRRLAASAGSRRGGFRGARTRDGRLSARRASHPKTCTANPDVERHAFRGARRHRRSR